MSFIRLHVIAEGRTEEKFVKDVLSKHLGNFNISTDARSVLTSKDRRTHKAYRGGLAEYERTKKDILAWIREDDHPQCRFTTMFDLYALPADFPGYQEAKSKNDPYRRVEILEAAFADDINDHRFVPYIQLHEFEALVFAEPQKLASEYLEHKQPIRNLVKLLNEMNGNPELIDDGKDTAPSKRILSEIPEYDKANVGPMIVERIVEMSGIEVLKQKCKHFNAWQKKPASIARSNYSSGRFCATGNRMSTENLCKKTMISEV